MFISLLPITAIKFPRDFRRKLEFGCASNETCSKSNTKATCCDLVFAIVISSQIPAEGHLQTRFRVANPISSHPKHLQRRQLRLHIQIRIDVSHQQIQMSQYLLAPNWVRLIIQRQTLDSLILSSTHANPQKWKKLKEIRTQDLPQQEKNTPKECHPREHHTLEIRNPCNT